MYGGKMEKLMKMSFNLFKPEFTTSHLNNTMLGQKRAIKIINSYFRWIKFIFAVLLLTLLSINFIIAYNLVVKRSIFNESISIAIVVFCVALSIYIVMSEGRQYQMVSKIVGSLKREPIISDIDIDAYLNYIDAAKSSLFSYFIKRIKNILKNMKYAYNDDKLSIKALQLQASELSDCIVLADSLKSHLLNENTEIISIIEQAKQQLATAIHTQDVKLPQTENEYLQVVESFNNLGGSREMNSLLTSKKIQLARIKEKIEQVKLYISQSNEYLKDLQDNLQKFRAKSDQLILDNQELVELSSKTYEQLILKKSSLEQELLCLSDNQEIADLNSAISALEAHYQRIQETLMNEQVQDRQILLNESKEFVEKISEMNDRLNLLKKENFDIKQNIHNQLETLDQDFKKFENENEKNKLDIECNELEIVRLKDTINDLERQKRQVLNELDRLQIKQEDYLQESIDCEIDFDQKLKSLLDLQNQISKLEMSSIELHKDVKKIDNHYEVINKNESILNNNLKKIEAIKLKANELKKEYQEHLDLLIEVKKPYL